MKRTKKLGLILVVGLFLSSQSSLRAGHAPTPSSSGPLDTAKYTRALVNKFTSPTFFGRGYTKNGMEKASHFIAREIQKNGLEPLNGNSYFQSYSHPVNTFPGKMRVRVNGKQLRPGVDFIVSAGSNGLNAEGTLIPSKDVVDQFEDPSQRLTVVFKDKLTFSVSKKELGKTEIFLDRKRFNSLFKTPPTRYKIDIENHFEPDFHAANVMGVVRGTVEPEKYLILTAHYDHLGGLGNHTYFPGANDNASGVSFLLGLARYYAENPAPYSIAFIFFGSEEAGLIGSKHYVTNPVFPLSQIRFLTNFDMVGTGDEGFTVVNATEHPNEFGSLQSLNAKLRAFIDVGARGKAANSDHYWFAESGVPAFFIYTRGGIKAYHDVFDRAETLPLQKVGDLQRLIIEFYSSLMSSSASN